MYINFDLLKAKGLNYGDVFFLLMVKQQKTENMLDHITNLVGAKEDYVAQTKEKGWVTEVRGKKSDPELSKLRISDKGQKLLDEIEVPLAMEQDEILFNWVAQKYKERDKEVGNAKKAKTNIALFRAHSGIMGNSLAFLVGKFLSDPNSQEYSQRADYIFFKPSNVYQTRFSLEDSKLWQFYQKNKSFFDEKFKEYQQ